MLSVCAIALNEAELIGRMLESARYLADEVVVGLDTRSSDRTAEIAESYGARVFELEWRDDFSYARNLTLEIASGDWILILDADERLTPAGVAAVRDVLAAAPDEAAPDAVTGLSFLIGQYDLLGRLLGVVPSSGRLFRRRPEIRYRGIVHEEPVWLPDPSRTRWALVSGALAIEHVGYDPSLWTGRDKRARNVRLLEKRLAENGADDYARAKLAHQLAVAEPWIEE